MHLVFQNATMNLSCALCKKIWKKKRSKVSRNIKHNEEKNTLWWKRNSWKLNFYPFSPLSSIHYYTLKTFLHSSLYLKVIKESQHRLFHLQFLYCTINMDDWTLHPARTHKVSCESTEDHVLAVNSSCLPNS